MMYGDYTTRQISNDSNGLPKQDSADYDPDVPGDSIRLDPIEHLRMHDTDHPVYDPEITKQLEICVRNLISSCKNVESNFLTLGQDLQDIHSNATELNQRTIKAIRAYGDDSDDRILDRVVVLAKKTLTELVSDCTQLEENIAQSEEIIERLNKLFSLSNSIKGTSKTLRMIGLNLNIESARIQNNQEIFINLAQEIKELSHSVNVLSTSMSEDVQSAQSNLITVKEDFGQSIHKLGEMAHSVENTLNEAAPAAKKIMDLSLSIFSRAGDYSGKISYRVGEIVVGIQIHDSINQRIEHITQSLDEAGTLYESSNEASGKDEKLTAAYSIVSLQAAQLDKIVSEIDTMLHQSLDAFHTIDRIIAETADQFSNMNSEDREFSELNANDNHNPIESLKFALEHTTAMIGQAANKIFDLNSVVEKSMQSMARLSSHMQDIVDINSEIRIGALNAIVNSARLGTEGAAISALVQEMSDMATQSDEFVNAVGEEIEKITGTTEMMKSRISNSQNDETAKPLVTGLDEFKGTCNVFRKESETIAEQGERLKEDISSVKQSLEFLNHFTSELNRQQDRLNTVKVKLSPWARINESDSVVDEDKIHQRYTMETEREIHEDFMKQPKDPIEFVIPRDFPETGDMDPNSDSFSKEPPAIQEKDPEDNDLGDNVELF